MLLESWPINKLKVLIHGLITVTLLLGVVWLRLNFVAFKLAVPDILYMLQPSFWLCILVLLLLLFISVQIMKFTHLFPIVSASLFILFPIVQWPTILGWDQLLHNSVCIDVISKSFTYDKYALYGLQYPGSYILANVTKVIIGINNLESTIFMSFIIRILILVLIYIFNRNAQGRDLAYISLTLLILGNYRLAEYFQYSPQELGFVFYLLLISLYLNYSLKSKFETISSKIMVLILTFSVVITHLFSTILLINTLVAFYFSSLIWRRKDDTNTQWLKLFGLSIVIWFAWYMYVSIDVLNEGIDKILTVMEEGLNLNIFVEKTLSFGRGVYNEVLMQYRHFILAFISINAVFGLFYCSNDKSKIRVVKYLTSLLLSTILFAFIMLIVSNPPNFIPLDRVILMCLISPAILATYSLNTIFKKYEYLVKFFSFICLILIPLSFLSSYQYIYMYSLKDWEIYSQKFLFEYAGSQTTISMMDSISRIIARYLSKVIYDGSEFKLDFIISRSEFVPSVDNIVKILNSLKLIFRTYRQNVDWYYVQGVDPKVWDELDFLLSLARNRVYDNGYIHLC